LDQSHITGFPLVITSDHPSRPFIALPSEDSGPPFSLAAIQAGFGRYSLPDPFS
jgi:hypothetical protein